jgi:hypothetical protein
MIKRLYPILILLLFAKTLTAQTVDIHFNGLGFLDNHEYKEFVSRSRTYSGTRLALDFGLNVDSVNRFVVGVNGLHEFGAHPFFGKADPVAYYQYHSQHWLFNAGEFPREGLIDNYPRAILNDTLRYYRPNVEGLLARYQNKHGYETFWLDWVSRQTDVDREQFLFGAEGKYIPKAGGSFYIAHYFLLMHDAGAAVLLPDDHINDNGGAQVRLGLDLTHKLTRLDSLTVEAGGMISLERSRGIDGFQTPKGFVASVYAGYHRIALFDEFYAGQGSHINYGDAYYSQPIYNRVDVIYTPFLFKGVKGQFVFSFHQTKISQASNQEAFRITYDLGRKTIARFKGE